MKQSFVYSARQHLSNRICDRCREELPESSGCFPESSGCFPDLQFLFCTVPNGVKILVFSLSCWGLAQDGPKSLSKSLNFRDFQFWPLPTVLHISSLHTALGHKVPHLYQSSALEWQQGLSTYLHLILQKKTTAINPWYHLKGQPPSNIKSVSSSTSVKFYVCMCLLTYPNVLHHA